MKIVSFKRRWTKLKQTLISIDLELFYEVVNIDGNLGRRIYSGCMREDNPRFNAHWFSSGRCHWNVILPCWLLNNRKLAGEYCILTNDKHSVIVHLSTMTVFDPTYEFMGHPLDGSAFKDGYQVVSLEDHILSLTDTPKVITEFWAFKARHGL